MANKVRDFKKAADGEGFVVELLVSIYMTYKDVVVPRRVAPQPQDGVTADIPHGRF